MWNRGSSAWLAALELNLLGLCVGSNVQVCPPDIDYIDIPSTWWDQEADKSLLIGVHKHGQKPSSVSNLGSPQVVSLCHQFSLYCVSLKVTSATTPCVQTHTCVSWRGWGCPTSPHCLLNWAPSRKGRPRPPTGAASLRSGPLSLLPALVLEAGPGPTFCWRPAAPLEQSINTVFMDRGGELFQHAWTGHHW